MLKAGELLRGSPRPLWPLGALYILALTMLWGVGFDHLKQIDTEEQFLKSHDTADGYLIPVVCAMFRGAEGVDFVKGNYVIAGQRYGNAGCLYTRTTFDNQFPELVAGIAPAEAHQAQIRRMHSSFKQPSKQNSIRDMTVVSLVWGLMFGLMGSFGHRRNRSLRKAIAKKEILTQ